MKFVKLAVALFAICTFIGATMPCEAWSMPMNPHAVVKTYPSNLDFATVRAKALEFIKSKGLTVFAEYDHAKNAAGVKLELAPTTVIVFGSPMVGTKLMQEYPGIGMVLPLKILISQDAEGKVALSHDFLAMAFAPYGVKSDNPILQKMNGLLKALADSATK